MTAWLEHYLAAQYEDGARGPERYDCWGLVREVRAKHLGCRLLPSFGAVRHDHLAEFTRAYRQEAEQMEECAPEVGAIAAVCRGALCFHVAVIIEVDGRLAALEISPPKGPRWSRLADFERQYPRREVRYYRDSSLCEQAAE